MKPFKLREILDKDLFSDLNFPHYGHCCIHDTVFHGRDGIADWKRNDEYVLFSENSNSYIH